MDAVQHPVTARTKQHLGRFYLRTMFAVCAAMSLLINIHVASVAASTPVAGTQVNASTAPTGSSCAVLLAPQTPADVAAKRSSKVLTKGCFTTLEEKENAKRQWARQYSPKPQANTASPAVAAETVFSMLYLFDSPNQQNLLVEYDVATCEGPYRVDDLGSFDNRAESASVGYCRRPIYLYNGPIDDFLSDRLRLDSYFNDLGPYMNNRVVAWNMVT